MLPHWLLTEIQQYVQGELVYIPSSEAGRAGWGQANGTRETYIKRNKEIFELFNEGTSIRALAEKYYLSEYSIKKIVSSMKNELYSCSR